MNKLLGLGMVACMALAMGCSSSNNTSAGMVSGECSKGAACCAKDGKDCTSQCKEGEKKADNKASMGMVGEKKEGCASSCGSAKTCDGAKSN